MIEGLTLSEWKEKNNSRNFRLLDSTRNSNMVAR